tara:strand:- start:2503 stop:4029 length:1527 start_codon:yes stop_codon:yes gene_type:complete
MKQKKSASILRKFLVFNFIVFSVLGIFTTLYLKAIQPSLVKDRTTNQKIVINNTKDHLERLNINFDQNEIRKFLLSARFLFQSLDRVQFFSSNGDIIGDTNILDLDQSVFERPEIILEEKLDGTIVSDKTKKLNINTNEKTKIQNIILKNENSNEPIILQNTINNNFFVSTLSRIEISGAKVGYIMVTEEANDILIAVAERKNFILRTVFAVALVILICSLFLNKYILKPIGLLVRYTETIKDKSEKNVNIDNYFVREDEVGQLTKSIDGMTKELQKRTVKAETFSTDLAHEIRNPLASLKGASELLDKSSSNKDSEKLLKIINHDVERIERLITDYSQMLKDEASLSREKMKKIDLVKVINNVIEDFNLDLINQQKKIEIILDYKRTNGKGLIILGIENRIEQMIANLLDNAISFSKPNQKIFVELSEMNNNFILLVKDQGPGFSENSTKKIFKRFYSNRPKSFGEHSGLGLNIVKNIVELHNGTIAASNRAETNGAQIEVLLPKAN